MSFVPESFTVWAEIPVSNLEKGVAYYSTVHQAELERMEMGPNITYVFPTGEGGTAGHIYEGKDTGQGKGVTIHLSIDGKLEAAMERVEKAGGTVVSEPIQIPQGRFAYTLDPDGNSIGLFEAA